jgi:DNA-binding MarR family transcriptional regulator
MDDRTRAFVDRLCAQAEADGLPRIAARLFGTLLLSPAPRSLDDLAAELGVSKASVSTDCRRLLERGIVERVTHPGDRRDFYQLAPDFFAQIIRQSSRRWAAMHELVTGLEQDAPDYPAPVRDRLAYVDAVHTSVCGRLDDLLREHGAAARRRAGPAGAATGT